MEKVITVGIKHKNTTKRELDNSMKELSRLIETAGGKISSTLVQRRQKLNPTYLIGEGKAEEIALLSRQNKTL